MPADPLTRRLNVRLTDVEDREVHAAIAAGLSVSDYARRRILGRHVASAVDASVRAEFSRIGGLIRRFAVDVAERISPTSLPLPLALPRTRNRQRSRGRRVAGTFPRIR